MLSNPKWSVRIFSSFQKHWKIQINCYLDISVIVSYTLHGNYAFSSEIFHFNTFIHSNTLKFTKKVLFRQLSIYIAQYFVQLTWSNMLLSQKSLLDSSHLFKNKRKLQLDTSVLISYLQQSKMLLNAKQSIRIVLFVHKHITFQQNGPLSIHFILFNWSNMLLNS